MSRKSVTEQVLEYLKEQIRVGRWTYGEKIDSENQLTYELQVSRASVRHAIQQLVALGVLESFQGKGTFVKTLPEDVMMSRLGNIYLNQDLHTGKLRTVLRRRLWKRWNRWRSIWSRAE